MTHAAVNLSEQEQDFCLDNERPEVVWARLFLQSNTSRVLPSYRALAEDLIEQPSFELHGLINFQLHSIGMLARVGNSVLTPELYRTLNFMIERDQLVDPIMMVGANRFVQVERSFAHAEYVSQLIACGATIIPHHNAQGELAGCSVVLLPNLSEKCFYMRLNIGVGAPYQVVDWGCS